MIKVTKYIIEKAYDATEFVLLGIGKIYWKVIQMEEQHGEK